MGDGADMALDDVMTMEELRLDYKLGDLTTQEAYDSGIIDELGYEINDKTGSNPGKTCRCCGITNLYWENVNGKWRLFDTKGLHKCSANPLKGT